MARRRSKPSRRSYLHVCGWIVSLNLIVALIVGGWYLLQPDTRQDEVQRLVRNTFARDNGVSAVDVAWDIWQLYYAESATGKIATGDKTFVYGGAPVLSGLASGIPLRVLSNRGYVVGYYEAKGNPAWVAYRIRNVQPIPTPAPRPEFFEIDGRTAARISSDDYRNSGYDRGHLAPNYAIATRFGEMAQGETFLMSNIAPQLHSLNAGLWKDLEMKIATSYPARYGEVWVFAGPIFGDRQIKLRDRVMVPEAFFMIVIDEQDGKLRTLAVIVPQDAAPDSGWSSYLTSVAEIQRRTRLDFFHELDDADEIEIEARRAERIW